MDTAKRLAFEAGFNPDQLVIGVDPAKDSKFLANGMAPVSIKDICPVFMYFYDKALEETRESV